jgi:hypothetical protein
VLCVVLAVVFVLGFFFDWVEIVLITFPVLRVVIDGLDFGERVTVAHLAPYWAGRAARAQPADVVPDAAVRLCAASCARVGARRG